MAAVDTLIFHGLYKYLVMFVLQGKKKGEEKNYIVDHFFQHGALGLLQGMARFSLEPVCLLCYISVDYSRYVNLCLTLMGRIESE